MVFWRIYVDGVEVKANGEEREPESDQAEGQGGRRFVLRYYSVFNSDHAIARRRLERESMRPRPLPLRPPQLGLEGAGERPFCQRVTAPPLRWATLNALELEPFGRTIK